MDIIYIYHIDILLDILSGILFDIYSDILSGICSNILSDVGTAHCDLELAAEIPLCPPRSAARSCDPRLPEETEEEGIRKKERATLIESGDPLVAGREKREPV